MHVPIQHIVGTLALIGLMISVGISYNIFITNVETDIRQKQLEQISENVALNLVELMNLAKFAQYGSSGYMMKAFYLPYDLSGRAYAIQIVSDTRGWGYVHAFLATQPSVYADAQIPFNSGETQIKLYTATDPIQHVQIDSTKIACNGTAYGGNDILVWAQQAWVEPYQINIGIGWVEAT